MNTIIITKDEIKLNSSLDESAFGRTNYFTLLPQEGMLFENNSFSPWKFDNITTFKGEEDNQEHVYYCGKNPFSEKSKTLLEFFEEENPNSDKLFNAVFAVVNAMTNAAKNNVKIPIVGAGGIIIDLQDSVEKSKIIFLPEELFKYSTNSLSQELYFNHHIGWINPTITDLPAICYQRALIIYKLLTNHFPFTETEETKRNADILDKNFLPLDIWIEGIDKDFAKEINKALKLNSTSIKEPGKRQKGVSSENLVANPELNLEKLKESWDFRKNINISDEDISSKTALYKKSQKAKINAHRNFRHNIPIFVGILVALIAVIFITVGSVKKQQEQYTSRGVTSTELIQNFFYGVNNKLIEVLSPIVSGSAPEKYVDKITDVYLLEKQITGFTKSDGYFYPENWLIAISNINNFNKVRLFGITNLKIDNVPVELELTLQRLQDNPVSITEENNKPIYQDDITTKQVEYYLLQTDPETLNINVTKLKDKFTLTYTHEKWLITDISSEQESIAVDTEIFKEDFYNKMAVYGNDIVKAVEALKFKYTWLPTKTAMIKALSLLK